MAMTNAGVHTERGVGAVKAAEMQLSHIHPPIEPRDCHLNGLRDYRLQSAGYQWIPLHRNEQALIERPAYRMILTTKEAIPTTGLSEDRWDSLLILDENRMRVRAEGEGYGGTAVHWVYTSYPLRLLGRTSQQPRKGL